MWDLPENQELAQLAAAIYEKGGVLGAVCHGTVGKRNVLRERLRTHKVFTKDQCFYLNHHKFSIKSYVWDVY